MPYMHTRDRTCIYTYGWRTIHVYFFFGIVCIYTGIWYCVRIYVIYYTDNTDKWLIFKDGSAYLCAGTWVTGSHPESPNIVARWTWPGEAHGPELTSEIAMDEWKTMVDDYAFYTMIKIYKHMTMIYNDIRWYTMIMLPIHMRQFSLGPCKALRVPTPFLKDTQRRGALENPIVDCHSPSAINHHHSPSWSIVADHPS